MPGFLSASTALTLFTIENPGVVTLEKLKQYAFTPIDSLPETQGLGWTNFDALFDVDWRCSVPQKGPYTVFTLRMDTRTLPAAILKKHLAEACQAEEEKTGAPPSRTKKRELKEFYATRLLLQTEPAPSSIDVVVNESGRIYLGTNSKTAVARFTEYFQRSFGAVPRLLPDLPSEEAEARVRALLLSLYTEGRTVSLDDRDYRVECGDAVSLAQDGAFVTVKNAMECARAGLDAGLSIEALQIRIRRADEEHQEWHCTLKKDGSISGFRTPKVQSPQEGDDPDAVLLEKLYLIEQGAGVLLEMLK